MRVAAGQTLRGDRAGGLNAELRRWPDGLSAQRSARARPPQWPASFVRSATAHTRHPARTLAVDSSADFVQRQIVGRHSLEIGQAMLFIKSAAFDEHVAVADQSADFGSRVFLPL